MLSVILNIITIILVVIICTVLYIGYNQNMDVQNLSQLFDRISEKGIKTPIKANITGPIGVFQPMYFGDLEPSSNPVLMDEKTGASIQELEQTRVPYYADFEIK